MTIQLHRLPPGLPERQAMYVRNFVFGSEDSLVSTVGLLSGIVSAGVARSDVITTGIILLFVEALSMAVGSYVSEDSAEEYLERKDVPVRNALVAGSIMFGSYFVCGFIPLGPYFFLDERPALIVSITASMVALGCLGYVSAHQSKVKSFPRVKRMMILGGLAIAIGVVLGRFLPHG